MPNRNRTQETRGERELLRRHRDDHRIDVTPGREVA